MDLLQQKKQKYYQNNGLILVYGLLPSLLFVGRRFGTPCRFNLLCRPENGTEKVVRNVGQKTSDAGQYPEDCS